MPDTPANGALNLPRISPKKPKYALAPWQVSFAFYLVNEGAFVGGRRNPPKEQQCEVATLFYNRGRDPELPRITITYDQIRTLRNRKDFQELLTRTREGGFEAARAMLVENLPAYVAAHMEALEWAREKRDYRAIPAITQQPLKAVIPESTQAQQVNVTISLSPARKALLDAVDAEVVTE